MDYTNRENIIEEKNIHDQYIRYGSWKDYFKGGVRKVESVAKYKDGMLMYTTTTPSGWRAGSGVTNSRSFYGMWDDATRFQYRLCRIITDIKELFRIVVWHIKSKKDSLVNRFKSKSNGNDYEILDTEKIDSRFDELAREMNKNI